MIQTSPAPARPRLRTFDEVGAEFGLTADEVTERLPKSMLVDVTRPGEPRQTKIPEYAIQAAGLDTPPLTNTDRALSRLVAFIARSSGRPFTNGDVTGASDLNEQAAKIALATMYALGLLQKSSEPPPNGRGGRQTVWRSID